MNGAVPSFLTQAQADEIRREAAQRELVIDFYEHARERAEQDRHEKRRRVRDGFVAVFVSICGVAMFLILAITLGAP
jgi:hypothetical protein